MSEVNEGEIVTLLGANGAGKRHHVARDQWSGAPCAKARSKIAWSLRRRHACASDRRSGRDRTRRRGAKSSRRQCQREPQHGASQPGRGESAIEADRCRGSSASSAWLEERKNEPAGYPPAVSSRCSPSSCADERLEICCWMSLRWPGAAPGGSHLRHVREINEAGVTILAGWSRMPVPAPSGAGYATGDRQHRPRWSGQPVISG